MKSKLFILFAVVLGTYSQATVSGGIVSITVENNSRFPYLLSVVHNMGIEHYMSPSRSKTISKHIPAYLPLFGMKKADCVEENCEFFAYAYKNPPSVEVVLDDGNKYNLIKVTSDLENIDETITLLQLPKAFGDKECTTIENMLTECTQEYILRFTFKDKFPNYVTKIAAVSYNYNIDLTTNNTYVDIKIRDSK